MEHLIPQTLVEFKTVDGMFIKSIFLPRKGLYPQHSHAFDHTSLLARGAVNLWKENEVLFYVAPAIIWIEKEVKHKFQTLEDETLIYCLHNLNGEEQVRVLEEHHLLEETL